MVLCVKIKLFKTFHQIQTFLKMRWVVYIDLKYSKYFHKMPLSEKENVFTLSKWIIDANTFSREENHTLYACSNTLTRSTLNRAAFNAMHVWQYFTCKYTCFDWDRRKFFFNTLQMHHVLLLNNGTIGASVKTTNTLLFHWTLINWLPFEFIGNRQGILMYFLKESKYTNKTASLLNLSFVYLCWWEFFRCHLHSITIFFLRK